MMLRRSFPVLASALMAISPSFAATTYHVSVTSGSDTNSGTDASSPFQTIQKACYVVNPGDTVIVYPGVYFEQIQIRRAGTAEAPITFKADAVGRKRVTVTLANPAVRQGKMTWTLEDPALAMYSIPYENPPVRVLYDDVDLMPYPTLDMLREFKGWSLDKPRGEKTAIGPSHGFAFDRTAKKLYVRLYQPENTRPFQPADTYKTPRHPATTDVGKYGSSDPNQHVMAVSPQIAGGDKGQYLDRKDSYIWGIMTEAPAFVILDGFTFETPGVAGVYVRGSDVTVRNSWFLGCKAGVAGGPADDNDEKWKYSDRVTIEYCDFSCFPAFTDMEETIQKNANNPAAGKWFWWMRKGVNGSGNGPWDYEIGGLIMYVAEDCVVKNNYIHEAFDGFSSGPKGSKNLKVYNNRFERMIDNAIQTEQHADTWRIYGNEFINGYMPISWQPEAGTPWPGPIYLYRNIFYNSPSISELWRLGGYPGAWLKAGARESNWKWPKHMKDVPRDSITIPGDGFIAFNNTVVMGDMYFLERTSGFPVKMLGFKFINNIFVTQPNYKDIVMSPDTAETWEFANNLYAPTSRMPTPPKPTISGKGGVVLDDAAKIGFVDVASMRFELTAGSPAVGAGQAIPGQPDSFNDMGAIPFGKAWESPKVGPQPR